MRCLLMIALAGSLGCDGRPEELTGSCAQFAGKYAIEYVGGALGEGELELVSSEGGVLEGRLTLWDDTGTDATVHLAGPGTCDREIVHLTFGSGDHPDARVRVMGGVATLVPPRQRVAKLFGVWEVKVVVKADERTRTLSGFLREAERS
jgi:hypothetical protein